MKIFAFLLSFFLTSTVLAKKISISFDDVPRKDTKYFSGKLRAVKLISALKDAQVSQAVFYANTAKVGEEGRERLSKYASAGHIIGNHSHSHPSANTVRPEVFITDIEASDKLLRSWGHPPTYFRFPYLHRGTSISTATRIREAIRSMGYQDGFVTVDNYDWYMDAQFQRSLLSGDKIDYRNLEKYYVEILTQGAEHYEKLALRVYGRSPAHVLLLHENDLAALFIKELVANLRNKGWEICSPEESYKDASLISFPRGVLRHDQGRVVAHATELGLAKPLISNFEDEATLDKLWKQYQVTKAVN